MATLLTSEPTQPRATAEEIFARVSAREQKLSRLLVFYISGGLLFMLLPGTFLGVWNLISISGRRAAESIPASWIQAHGHAQVLGWIGSFILGIGYYSIPKLRRSSKPFALGSAWFAGTLWMTGVLLRWFANVYLWQWRVLLPVSATFELTAFLMFFRAVSQHKPQDSGKPKLETWIFVVIAGAIGLLVTLVLNLGACVWLSLRSSSPAFPQTFDQRFLIVAAWGFMVFFVWGFSAKWLPVFLGTRDPDNRLLGIAVAVQVVAVGFGLAGILRTATALLVFRHCWRFGPASLLPSITSRKDEGRTYQLSNIRAFGVCVADDCRAARRMGCECDKSVGHLGSFAPCAHGGLCRHDGFLCGTARPARFLGNALAVQQQTHVCRTAFTHGGLCASRQRRGPGLPGDRSGGVDVAPVLGNSRAFRRHDIRHQSGSHIHAETCPAATESD